MKVERIAILVVNTRMKEDIAAADQKDALALQGAMLRPRAIEGVKAMEGLQQREVQVFTLTTRKSGKKFEGDSALAREIGKFFAGSRTYGMYILMHGGGGRPSSTNAAVKEKSVAGFVQTVAKHAGKAEFRKLNLVACTLGARPGELGLGKTDTCYAAALCEAIGMEGIMVAAYTVPVYVNRPDNHEFKGEFGNPDVEVDRRSRMGGKLVSTYKDGKGGQLDMATAAKLADNNRGLYKTVWTLRGKEAVPVPVEAYHKA